MEMVIKLLSSIRHDGMDVEKGKIIKISERDGCRLISLGIAEYIDAGEGEVAPPPAVDDEALDLNNIDKETACILESCDSALLLELRAKTNKVLREELIGMGVTLTNRENKAGLIALYIENMYKDGVETKAELLKRAETMTVEELASELAIFGISTEVSDTKEKLFELLKIELSK